MRKNAAWVAVASLALLGFAALLLERARPAYATLSLLGGLALPFVPLVGSRRARAAEEKLLHAEAKFRELFNSAADAIVIHDLDGRILEVNRAACERFEYTRNELLGLRLPQLIGPRQEGSLAARVEALKRSEYAIFESEHVSRSGRVIPVEVHSNLIEYEGRRAVLAVGRDISERRKAEVKLRQRERMLSLIVNAVPQTIFWKDRSSVYLGCNENFVRAAGLADASDVVGKTDYDLPWLPHEADAFRRDDQEVLQTGRSKRGILESLRQSDGSVIWTETTKVPLVGEDGSIFGVLGVYDDVTERRRTEAALRESEARLRVIFETSPAGIFQLGPSGRFTFGNRRLAELFGCSLPELLGTFYPDHVHPDERQFGAARMWALLRGEYEHALNERRYVRKDGTAFWGYLSCKLLDAPAGSPPSAVGIIADITEKKAFEEELLRARKLDSLGILAGGIAHDFNNLLTGIMGNLSMARAQLRPGAKPALFLERAEKATDRATELTRQLLTFSKGGLPVKKLASLPRVLTEAAEFTLSGSNVRARFELAEDLWPAEVDVGQIGQVIQNLVLNAAQAMPGGGVVEIRAQNEPRAEEGGPGWVRIVVEDAGAGIPAEELDRIFDPYYTTKPNGTGLGLATVYSIVRNHDGEIRVTSRVGKGTAFTLHLPASPRDAIPAEGANELPSAGNGRVLVMDDEEMIRDLVGSVLESLGYEPTTCADGAEALRLYEAARRAGRPFSAVVMDLTIPGAMGGKEAVRRLVELDPAARVIVSSGYSNDPVMASFREHGFCGAVAKPFKVGELAAALAEALAESPRGVGPRERGRNGEAADG